MTRIARPAAWLLALLLLLIGGGLVVSQSALAQGKPGDDDEDEKEMADKDKDDKPVKGDKPDSADKSSKTAKADKDAGPKIYLLKTNKKGKLNGAEVMSLVLFDVFSRKTETMFVPNSDPKGREYDPLPDVAAAVESIEEGAPVQVEAKKEKGKWMVTSLAKADVKPGEELEMNYVYVEHDEVEDRGGNKTVVVTLSKFGREVKVAVPMWKNKEYKEANWEPDPKIDRQLRELSAGEVVEAKIEKGKPPKLVELYRFYPPERGKFVKVKETTHRGATAAAFELLAADGTTLTITLDGTEKKQGETTILVPDRKQFNTIKQLKPDTELIVIYREEGQTMFLRELRFPKTGDKPAGDKGDSAEKEKMKPEGGDKAGADKDAKGDKSGGGDADRKGDKKS